MVGLLLAAEEAAPVVVLEPDRSVKSVPVALLPPLPSAAAFDPVYFLCMVFYFAVFMFFTTTKQQKRKTNFFKL